MMSTRPHRPRPRIAIAALLLVVLTPATVADDAEHVIPSDRCRGLWLVTIDYRDGDDGSLYMVLDTGASHTAVDPQSLKRVFGKRVREGKRVNMRDGTLGPLKVNRLKATIHDMDHLSRALGRDIDGILGFPTFKSMLLTLDYLNDEIRVRNGKLPEPDGETVFRDYGKVRPYLKVDLAGTPVAVLIDSGSGGGFRFDIDDEIPWIVDPRPTSTTTGYDEIRLSRTGRIAEDVPVGPLVVKTPVARIHDGTRLMGFEVLYRFALTFDQRRRRIRMIADSSDPIVMGPERGLGMGFKPVAEGFEIVRIFDGMPASKVDLAEGDLVVAVDGVPFAQRDCDPGFGPDDKSHVTLTVRTGSEERDVVVEVADLVP